MPLRSLDLTGRTAVVIGATSGIGKAIALGLADAGADVVPTGRRTELAAVAAREVEARGRRSLATTADVSDANSLQALCDASITAFGKVDILVNAAGRSVRRPTLDVSDREWEEILDTNLTGMLRACRIFGRHMVERRYGRIINIGSLTSVVALHEVAAYGASKAGVASLTKSLAVEWAPHGVCVNAILPGVFRTALNEGLLDGTERGREFLVRTPMRRFGQPEEVAGAAVFLASDAASFVTGHLLAVDGGFLASGVNQ
jgi:NAD(P)-dependent dehydrogenase (short-subunit alcohol dehydrogenase family)